MKRYFWEKFSEKPIYILLLVCICAQLPMATNSDAAADERVLDFHVVHRASKEPLPDVTLEIQVNGREIQERKLWTDKTDAQGRCQIQFPDFQIREFRVYPQKEGFVTLRIFWRGDPTEPDIPETFTVAMEPGTTIGGTIRNEQGEPIEGVLIGLHYYKDDLAGAENARVNIVERSDRIKTDNQGRWRYDRMPSEIDMSELRIFLTHPDYLSDILSRGFIPMPITPQPPIEKLRDLSSVMVMKKGFSVTGRVVDKQGTPVSGAKIYNTESYWLRSKEPFAETDAQAHFKSDPSKTRQGQTVLTIQASGYAPELKMVSIQPDMPALEFRLEPGGEIQGRVTNKNGEPVEGAYVSARTWRGERARLHLEVKTNADGNFEIADAPADEVLFDISKQGFMVLENYAMMPGQAGYKIQLRPPLKVQGKVIDVETNQPIDKFTVMHGVDFEDGRAPFWDKFDIQTHTKGQYEIEFRQEIFTYRIRVDAEGYQSAISDFIRPEEISESSIVCDFKLDKEAPAKGIVLSPDGKPLSDAEVVIATHWLSILNGMEVSRSSEENLILHTDADGKFSFVPPVTKYVIIALHEQGYAKVTKQEFEASSTITVSAWGRIEGIYKVGTKPGVGASVDFLHKYNGDDGPPRVAFRYETKTDQNGHFIFSRVLPGEGLVARAIPIARGRLFSHTVLVDVESGKTTRVQIGGTGRPVTGKVVVPDYIKDKFNWEYTDYRLSINSPENPYKQLSFRVDDNGSFRIDDVPTGDYCLYFYAYGPPPNSRTRQGERIGLISCPFIIPEMPEGRSDEPLELGMLEMEVIGGAALAPSLIDKALPEFRNIKIEFGSEETKGNMMLICFFDYEQRPSRNCIMQLSKKAQELKTKDVVVVAVQASKVDESELDEWVKKNNVPFPVGMIEGDEKKTRFNWGVKSLPWLILTDRKHVVVGEGFALQELDDKLKTD